MIVLSLILVIIAAVTLLAGFFSEGLTLIWVSIGACVLSIATLALGVMQRRRTTPEPVPPSAYGPGAAGPKPAPAQLATVGAASEPATEVIARTSAREAADRRDDVEAVIADAEVEIIKPVAAAPAAAAAPSAARRPTRKKATRKKATRKKATRKKAATKKAATKKAATKKAATKKAATKKAATKKAATKKAATKKAATKKAATKKAAGGRTSGAAARATLAAIQGVGAAKQDALLKRFRSIEAIRAASVDELSAVEGVGPTAATKIKDSLG